MSLTSRIVEDVSSAFDVSSISRWKFCIIGLGDDTSFDYNGHDLSLIVLSSESNAIESYCGITNINALFFNLSNSIQ